MVHTSPFFRQPAFERLRESLRQPEVAFAHPLDGGEAAAALPSVSATAESLGVDGRAYRQSVGTDGRQCRGYRGCHSGAVTLRAPPSGLPGSIRSARAPSGLPAREAVRDRAGQSPPGRGVGPLDGPVDRSADQRLRTVPDPHRPLGRLARGRVGQLGHRRCHGHRARTSGGNGLHGAVGTLPGRAPALHRGGGGRVAEGPGRHGRRRAAVRLRAGAASVPLRPRRVQGGLGPVGAGALDGRGVPSGRDPPSRRDIRRGGGQRGRRERRTAPGAALLHRGPGRSGRPHPGPGRTGGPLGLLPRPVGIDRGHEWGHRGPDRAIRSRASPIW